jgi:hypothetical protein
MRNLIRALRGKPVELSPKQEEKMARAQARADAMIADAEARGREAEVEAARFMAGRSAAQGGASFGAPAAPGAPAQTPPGEMPSIRGMLKQSFEGFRDAVGEMFDDRSGIIDAGEGADLNRPPPELADPAERATVAAVERRARDLARARYRAAQAPEVAFTRFPTTGATQLDDVTAHLRAGGLAARPERVFGVYRVPDRFDLNRNGEGRTFLEWEIAHAPGALPPASDEVLTTAFRRDSHWVARQPGEPSVIDEDVAGTLAGRAGLAPEDCFGLTRLLQVRGSDQENGKSWYTHVEGALLFTRALPAVTRAHEQLMAEAPLALPSRAVLPFHVEILDWEAVAAWVAPDRNGPPRLPSPLPHLPSDWQELLLCYLEVVGVRSEDCYGAQVTRTTERLLSDLSLASARKNFRSPPKTTSADGKERSRLHAAEHVVIAYRDRAEYQDGRARWRAYQDEVLHAKLDHLSELRPAIEVDLNPRQSFLSEVFDSFNPLDPMVGFPQLFNRNEKPSLGPYCGSYEG